MAKNLLIVGTDGYINGEEFKMPFGNTLSIGRSRSADISYRMMRSYSEMTEEERDSKDFLSISGIHFEINTENEKKIVIRDKSSNGTFVDGQRVDEMEINDLAEKEHEISFGKNEKVILKIID